MENKNRNFFYRFFQRLNTLRLIIINIVFFSFLLFLFTTVGKYNAEHPVKRVVPEAGAVLMIDPSGMLVEKADDLQWAAYLLDEELSYVLLDSITSALKHAAHDRRITSVFFDLSGLYGISSGHFLELKEALKAYKESEKPLYVFCDSYHLGTYYIASFADRIYLDPMGDVQLSGFYSESVFYGEMEQKFGIQWNVLQAGSYKGMAETYSRTGMSDGVRSNYESVFKDLWNRYVDEVAENRKLDKTLITSFASDYTAVLEDSNGDGAAAALSSGLVTHIATYDECGFELGLCDEYCYPTDTLISYADYNAAFKQVETADQIGIIHLSGVITGSEGRDTETAAVSSRLQALFDKAASDDAVKAVVLRVDSGGGEVLASEDIRRNVAWLSTKIEKPVIVSMGAVAASGAYWIASAADYVFASPYTITGSIGVLAVMPTFQNVLKDYFGIYADSVSAAGNKPYSPFTALNPAAKKQAELEISHTYHVFLETVSNGRNIPVETLYELAQGKIYSGSQAQAIKLVDELGSLHDAIAYAASVSGIEEHYSAKVIEEDIPLKEKILRSIMLGDASAYRRSDLSILYELLRLKSKKGFYVYTPVRVLWEE